MTYAIGGLIQALDYNGFATTNTPNVNNIWSVGSGNSGYGQPVITSVAAGAPILGTEFFNLVQSVQKSASHQGTALGTWRQVSPSSGGIILFEPNLANNINLINTNRLNAASQGSTSTTTATSTTSWNSYLTATFTVTFSSANAARYYFNAGGQIGFNFSHPAGTGANATINTICTNTGSIWLSSPTSGTATLSGVSYNGVTKIGGGDPVNSTINANRGFYALNGTSAQLFQQSGSGSYYYYGGSFLRISASYNGAGVLTLTCRFEETGGYYYYYYGGVVSAGTQSSLIIRPPSTTYLANTWGTPTVTSSVVAT